MRSEIVNSVIISATIALLMFWLGFWIGGRNKKAVQENLDLAIELKDKYKEAFCKCQSNTLHYNDSIKLHCICR